MGGGCAQTPPPPLLVGMTGPTGGSETGWDNESKDPDKVSALHLTWFSLCFSPNAGKHRIPFNLYISVNSSVKRQKWYSLVQK